EATHGLQPRGPAGPRVFERMREGDRRTPSGALRNPWPWAVLSWSSYTQPGSNSTPRRNVAPTDSSPFPNAKVARAESSDFHVILGKRSCAPGTGPEGPSAGTTLQPSSLTGRSKRTAISRRAGSTVSHPFSTQGHTIL